MSASFWNGILRDHADANTIADRVAKAVTPIESARTMAVRNFRHRADIAEAEGSLILAGLHRETADRIEAGIQDNNAEVQHYLARLTGEIA